MQRHNKIILASLGMGLLLLLGAMTVPTAQIQQNTPTVNTADLDEQNVWDLYKKLGKTGAPDLKSSIAGASAEKGKDLVHKGYTIGPNGKRTKQQSKFYVCTTCHNTVREFENLAEISPENKLAYAIKNQVHFLQASTFHGIVNRTNYYNDDYQKKYANVPGIKEAKTDLRQAIQFCSVTCSQGRELADWEVESILAYFWNMQYKVSDLGLTAAEKELLKGALDKGENSQKAIQLLDSKYAAAYPAHFTEAPKYEAVTAPLADDATRIKEGKAIFELGCLHCHENERYSFYGLDNTRLTFKHLESAARTENYIYSLYMLTREGLPPRMGRLAYMPEYTLEKMSEAQLKSLYIYVQAMAKGKKMQ